MPGLVCRGRLGKATGRAPSMYVDEKSDEAILTASIASMKPPKNRKAKTAVGTAKAYRQRRRQKMSPIG